mmetsp:Transcript_84819/g.150194  ORF Transcript_84819/g.150194 Transcript_84819/m.150194 type:complete len:216 (-) Transcript_84819:80-727(-)
MSFSTKPAAPAPATGTGPAPAADNQSQSIVPDFEKLQDIDILMWVSPTRSASALIGINVVFFIYLWEFSPTSVLIKLGLFGIGIGGAMKFTGVKELPTALPWIEKSAETKLADVAFSALESTVKFAEHICFWKNQADTVKVLVVLYVLRCICSLVRFSFIMFIICNLMFVLPYALKSQKQKISDTVAPLWKKAQEEIDKLLLKVPKYSDIAKDDD